MLEWWTTFGWECCYDDFCAFESCGVVGVEVNSVNDAPDCVGENWGVGDNSGWGDAGEEAEGLRWIGGADLL